MTERGSLYVISAPSGAGKNALLDEVRRRETRIASTVSATTRAPRSGERDGVDYHFLDRDAFQRRVAAGDFAEWAEVHGNLYGTLRSELDRCLATGSDVILELDVQGIECICHLIWAAALNTLNNYVIHSVILHSPHKLLEKLGTLFVTLWIGQNGNHVKVFTIHLTL